MGRKKNKHLKKKVTVCNNENEGSILKLENDQESLGNPEVHEATEVKTCAINNKINIPLIKDNRVNDDSEIRFETYVPNSERVTGREYFVHSLCQICKEDLKERVPCPKCMLVTYCSQSHRREHWPVHADLCAAIVDICKEREVDHIMQGAHNFPPDKFRIFRFQNMVECENKVERPLEKWEREMFIFPNVCGMCHNYDIEDLVICTGCHHSGFCKGHCIERHKHWCEHLVRYKKIVKDQTTFGVVCPSIPKCKMSLVLPKLFNMEQFFKGVSNKIDYFEFLELTEITTYPLTALNALLRTEKNQLFTKLTFHIVGAEPDFETNKLEKWEYYVLHLIPGLQMLDIEFVGPELNSVIKSGAHKVCPQCVAAKKSINFKFHNQLYHTFSGQPSSSKPHLICVFNPGLYRSTGFNNEDTWSPSITSMFAQNCPVLTTSYTHKEILLDVQRVRTTQHISLEIEPILNPFSSLKPSLNFVSDEESPVIFKNQYYCIMTK